MQFHWRVLIWMLAGIVVGLLIQTFFSAPAYTGLKLVETETGLVVESISGPPASEEAFKQDMILQQVVRYRGTPREERLTLRTINDFQTLVAQSEHGQVLWFQPSGSKTPISLTLGIHPESALRAVLAPFTFFADIFLTLLKMLIVPIVFTSIVSGVASLGGMQDLKRLGSKTFVYYISTSLLAILVGQIIVNIIRPGTGAALGLAQVGASTVSPNVSLIDIITRMVPSNILSALSDNSAMLQIIFFGLLFGFALATTAAPYGPKMRQWFESLLEVIMRMAAIILKLIPYGVFFLLVKVVSTTGFAIFRPLLLYMVTVIIALLLHAMVTLPIILKWVGHISPIKWFRAMSPALITSFSTSSSSMTLPVTLETVEHRGKVSPTVASFTLPLGATINMDGTALYECIGVIFLAQYYASAGGFELTWVAQATVIFMALLASIGAAGIPSAGLVMMLTILSALGLPLEGAALLLAVDRPLDMLRTTVNVWSDSCGAAVIAKSEGEHGIAG